MKYEKRLVYISDSLEVSDSMYALICLRAECLSITLSGVRCFLDGYYLLCLSQDDRLTVHGGNYEAIQLRFLPYFYNVNLSHDVIGLSMYHEMRTRYGYPDFHLFRLRDDRFCGVLSLTAETYEMVREHFRLARHHIDDHPTDVMWSCRTRSDMIAILRIAEGAYTGENAEPGSEILRWIRGNLEKEITLDSLCARFHTNRTSLSRKIRQLTGFSPMQYVLEERLNQSRPDLLFTWVSIGEVAEKYGFSDANYYIRAFRKRFGVSPHQYRTQGRDERIRNEKLYHERMRNMMSPEEFRLYMEKGLGRAVLLLQKEEDPGRFEETLWTFLTEEAFPRRLPGDYDKKLIDCLPHPEAFMERLASHFLPMLEKKRPRRFPFRLLILGGYEEPMKEWAEREYRESYADLLAHLRRGGSEERCPDWATRYRNAAADLGAFFADEKGMRRILTDLADLYEYSETPHVPEYQNPLFAVLGERGRAFLWPLMDEAAAQHPHGDRIHLRHELFEITRPEPMRDLTMERLLEGAKLDWSRQRPLVLAFDKAGEELVHQAAERAMSEKDPLLRRYLLSLFVEEEEPLEWEWNHRPPAFPLSPERLIAEAEGYLAHPETWEDKENRGVPYMVLRVLSEIRHPLVLRWAKELLLRIPPQPQSYVRSCALRMRWGANYTSRDKGEFASLLEMADSPDYDTAVHIFMRGLLRETPDLPLEKIPVVFAASEMARRRDLVEILLKKNRLPEELREECRYDAVGRIRRMIQEDEEK